MFFSRSSGKCFTNVLVIASQLFSIWYIYIYIYIYVYIHRKSSDPRKISLERICWQWSRRFLGFSTTKSEFLFIYFSGFCQLFRYTYFKEHIFMTTSAIYIFKYIYLHIFLLSCKQASKKVGLYRKFPNVLPRTSKLLVRPHLDHRNIIHDQIHNFCLSSEIAIISE